MPVDDNGYSACKLELVSLYRLDVAVSCQVDFL